MGSVYKRQLNEWKATLEVTADDVLDIGGAQDPIHRHVKYWDVKNYEIMDLEEPHVKEIEPDICHDLNEPLLQYRQYDIVFCLGVFDYVIEPGIAMRNVRKLIKPGGHAWVEFPFVYAHHNPIDDEGCRYSEGCIKRLAKQAGLEITEIIRKPAGNEHLLEFYRQDGHRMAREYEHHNVTGFIVRFEHGS